MTGEEKTGEDTPDEFEGQDVDEFTKDELEEILEADSPDDKTDEKDKEEPAKETADVKDEHPKGYVPLKALQEARAKIKGKETEIGELHQWQAQLAEKLADHRTAPKVEEAQAPIDPNEDPMGYMENLGKQVEDMQVASQKNAEEYQQVQAQRTREDQTISGFIGYRDELVSADPETAKALDFAITQQGEAYKKNGLEGVALNNAMRNEMIRQANIVGSLPEEQRKQHVLGTARYFGYQAAESKQDDTAKEKIDKLEAIKSATKTLSGGGAAGGEMTLEDVANMSGAELDKIALDDPEFFARLGYGS